MFRLLLNFIERFSFFNRLSQDQKKVISKNYSFYRNLSLKDKNKFNYRVAIFIKKHDFIARENIVLDDKIKAIIAAVAIMLTFKKRNYLYEPFERIIVYPNSFTSVSTNNLHKGETNPRLKVIAFSLADFLEGIIIDNDNLNLGIHEFTHALLFSNLKQNSYESQRFKYAVNAVFNYFIDEDKLTETKSTKLFREYGFVNKHEFLSVITENYFENPLPFKQKLPELFFLVNKLFSIY